MLIIKNLKKKFGNNEVLKNVSLTVKDSEIVVILGKSGEGKTTLIRCINDLEAFDSGSITVDDICVDTPSQMKKLSRKIGMVFQNFNLFPHLTVLENITVSPINIFDVDKNEASKKALELLEVVDLLDKKDEYPYQLSGGQRQRAAIARSCALSPKVLCFDEPTSALDKSNIENVKKILNRLKKQGLSILIITHDVQFACEVADKIVEIKDGILYEQKGKD